VEAAQIVAVVAVVIVVLVLVTSLKTVAQGTVAVTTLFGKYRRVLRPGLHLLVPFVERVQSRPTTQNRSVELQFQAITQDQANVHFAAMLLFAAFDDSEQTIKNIAFKFESTRSFMTALTRSIEGSVRGFVATKKQSEILSLRSEIVAEVKEQLDATLESWGYHLSDLQLNDITFDQVITESMARVVASNNLKAAATNEGDALRIKMTKEAEAQGAAITIAAEAEKTASQLRGQGVALFREEVAKGLAEAANAMGAEGVDPALILFSMWTETIRQMAEQGRGNIFFLDGSPEGMQKSFQQLAGLNMATLGGSVELPPKAPARRNGPGPLPPPPAGLSPGAGPR
jgi:regulator of protease activity HflC (stomatin/prohibitin superfamily)